ncbi:hypothetical protein Tco_0167655 [Tanacetum coccineum]
MLVPQVVEGEGLGQPSEPQPPSSTASPSQVTTVATQHQKTHKPRVVQATTTASSLEADQESGSGPKRQDTTLRGANAQTWFETASKKSYDPPLSEDCSRPGDPTAEIESQKIRKGTKGKNSKNEALQDCDFDILDDAMENVEGGSTDEQITTAGDTLNTSSISVSTDGPSNVSTARTSNVSVVGPSTSTAGDIFKDEMTTIVDTLMAIRSARPRTTLVMIRNVEEEPGRATPVPTVQSQDKGKGKMFEKEKRIAREKAAEQEAKDTALIEQMEDVQARMDADELLAERLQQEEREQITVDEQARMLVDLIAERKKFFVA